MRLRDYNLRIARDGMLVPISSERPIPIVIDVTPPTAASATLGLAGDETFGLPGSETLGLPSSETLGLPTGAETFGRPDLTLAQPDLAEGTIDGLEAVRGPALVSPRNTFNHAAPPPPRSPFSDDADDELPYVPWTDES